MKITQTEMKAIALEYSPGRPIVLYLLLGWMPVLLIAVIFGTRDPNSLVSPPDWTISIKILSIALGVGPLIYPLGELLRRHFVLTVLAIAAVCVWAVAQPWGLQVLFCGIVVGVPAWLILQTRSLFDYKLVISDKGIHLPLKTCLFPIWNLRFDWDELLMIDCVETNKSMLKSFDPDDDPYQNYSLIFKSCWLGSREIRLKYFHAEQRSQMFLAIRRWAKSATISSELALLIQNLDRPAIRSKVQSFTNVWEDDLKTCLNPTTYVPLSVGQKIGQYKITKHLASGGQATTYLALNEIGKIVVLKEYLLPHQSAAGARNQFEEMFKRESQLLQACNHPGIAKVLDYFTDRDRNYLVLNHIPGDNARKRIQLFGVMEESDVKLVALQLAEILIYLHGLDPSVLHRDLTPDNMIFDGSLSVSLIDFGAANQVLSNATGTAIGKQAYMAPEQFKGKACAASDIYSLGCSMYYFLTARNPLPLSVAHPRLYNPSVTTQLDDLIARCTAQDLQAGRVMSAAELVGELKALVAVTSRPKVFLHD